MIAVTYQGRGYATVDDGGIQLLPAVEAFEDDHPLRRWAYCMSVYAHEVVAGRFPQPYTPDGACHFARNALLPDEEFVALYHCEDAALAEHFNVPLQEIDEKRRDLMTRAIGEPTPPF